ncbi:MAG: protein kinase [Lachnospiraceae bacterium]|nr:protein kinase [Lachnospiraceae bacterium]
MNAGEILNSTYEIKEQIGSGGGGTIYKAYHKRLQKDVVLKKIHKSGARNEDEKEILKNIKHSYLPQVYDFLDVEDGVFTIIDYIPGKSFEKLLKEQGRFSQKKVVKYGIQLCEVVSYLHRQKPPIIHGDIKPANIMLTPEDNICLIDFNISGVLDGKSMAATGYTPGYASPEQAASFHSAGIFQTAVPTQNSVKSKPMMKNGKTELLVEDTATELLDDDAATELLDEDTTTELLSEDAPTELLDEDTATELLDEDAPTELLKKEEKLERPQDSRQKISHTYQMDVRSDVYSIAATLYHFLTGIKPDSDPEKIVKPSELNDSIGESISIILMKALSKDPGKRFQTAEDMLQAFRKIHKYDFRYKKMVIKQEMIFLATVVGIGIGVLLTFFGKRQLEVEKEEAYVQAVALLSDAVTEKSEEALVEDKYNAAIQIKPERLEAYFQKARYLYEEREYETAIAYIEETILPEEGFYGQEMMADIYFILGNCRFELEQYEDAIIAYRTAIKMEDAGPEFYRDYVISLVRNNEVDKAEEALKEAEEKGISSIDLLLANGELKKAKGDYEGAEKDLQQCISDTEDDYIRMRAYVICDMVYREQDGALRTSEDGNDNLEYLLKSQSLLEKARTEVGLENRLLIYERLAQTYIDLQKLTADAGYGESAVAVLQEVIDQGWGTYLTYNNIVILYQKMGQLEKAQAMLDQMLEMDAENYNTYKRMAFLEVEKQNQKENANRQYADFIQYYEKAKDLCADTPQGSQDVEMQLLDSFYNQLEEGGWLK